MLIFILFIEFYLKLAFYKLFLVKTNNFILFHTFKFKKLKNFSIKISKYIIILIEYDYQ